VWRVNIVDVLYVLTNRTMRPVEIVLRKGKRGEGMIKEVILTKVHGKHA
jgi:hypothetical protein